MYFCLYLGFWSLCRFQFARVRWCGRFSGDIVKNEA
jgi:hypothetical protein